MIVLCPACQARFQYDDDRFGHARGKRFKCPKCAHIFEVANPRLTRPIEPPPGVPPAESRTMPPAVTLSAPEDETLASNSAPTARTTAKRGRDSMLASAGLDPSGMPPGLRFSLAFLTGPQASTVQVLNRPKILIGREEGDVVTRDPETSRRHALLEIRPNGTVWISDQNSTNGILINGERVVEPVQLTSQQEFTCGNSTFMLLIRNTEEFPLS